ncbi:MAG: hypothetical protein M3R13_12165 [Armatimonadota bacterium]|nr:hypothetical protein [Chthoniobacterales bacterium]MDQ2987449.1 hypothetical protein [Armatimonadota bacterium]
MGAFLVFLQGAAAPHSSTFGPAWEIVKTIIITLGTAAAIGSFRMMQSVRDDVRDTKREVFGQNGKDGLRGNTRLHDARLDELEEWRTKLDTATAIELELWQGKDRRQKARRLRDRLLQGEFREDEGEGAEDLG